MKPIRVDKLRLCVPRQGAMVTDATIFVSDRIDLEPEAVGQLVDAASLSPVRRALATADIHVGFGVPIGAVLGMDEAIMPPAVGYDINCGMRLLHTPFRKGEIDVEAIAASIARDVPLGEGQTNLPLTREQGEAVCAEGVAAIPELAQSVKHRVWEAFDESQYAWDRLRIEENGCMDGDAGATPDTAMNKGRGQLGTLGGGNHFIEIQEVETVFNEDLAEAFGLFKDQIVVMIHSGSRRFGYEVADHYMNVAAREPGMEGRRKMLAYLPADSRQGQRYIKAMAAAANFGFVNRHVMALSVRRCFNRMYGPVSLPLVYDVTHNMAKFETHEGRGLWVHRKGATRAFGPDRMAGTPFEKTGQPIITPGSMGTASYLMVGTGASQESLCSVNHGAGRVLSRTAALGKTRRGRVIAQAAISDDAFKRSISHIKLITPNRRKVKEEAPAAYKDIDEVVRIVAECGWARRVARLTPLAVLKG